MYIVYKFQQNSTSFQLDNHVNLKKKQHKISLNSLNLKKSKLGFSNKTLKMIKMKIPKTTKANKKILSSLKPMRIRRSSKLQQRIKNLT